MLILALIPIIIYLGACAIYYHKECVDCRKKVSHLNNVNKAIISIAYDYTLSSDEKIKMMKKEYDNVPF